MSSKFLFLCVLYDNTLNGYDYMVSVTDEGKSMGHWWNNMTMAEPKQSDRKLSQC
jgi:hypothetical protein